MPVLLSIIILLCDRSLIIESIPKLGHILSDPLSNEAKLSGKDFKNIMFNVINNSFHDTSTEEHKDLLIPTKFDLRKSENTESTQSPSYGYDFNDTLINNSFHDTSTEEHKDLLIPTKFDLRKSENTESIQSPSYGYDFNDTICKTVDERVICGYNKNIGNVDPKIVDLGNGCRIRGNRLECGYIAGPFNNPRRPPANDPGNEPESNNRKLSENISKELIKQNTARNNPDTSTRGSTTKLTKMTKKKNTTKSTINIKAATSTISKLFKNITTTLLTKSGLTSRSSTFTSSYTNKVSGNVAAVTKRSKRHCVEKNDNIFCYSIKKPN